MHTQLFPWLLPAGNLPLVLAQDPPSTGSELIPHPKGLGGGTAIAGTLCCPHPLCAHTEQERMVEQRNPLGGYQNCLSVTPQMAQGNGASRVPARCDPKTHQESRDCATNSCPELCLMPSAVSPTHQGPATTPQPGPRAPSQPSSPQNNGIGHRVWDLLGALSHRSL